MPCKQRESATGLILLQLLERGFHGSHVGACWKSISCPGKRADEVQARCFSQRWRRSLPFDLDWQMPGTGKPPYFWALIWDHTQRQAMLKDGWKSISRVFILALVLDVVYQIIVLRFVYPGEAVIVAFVLAIFHTLIVRGLVTRVARKKRVESESKGRARRIAA